MKRTQAHIIREYGPFPGVQAVHGVTYDGRQVWFATGEQLIAMDPDSGSTQASIDMVANAGTAFDGKHLYQISDGSIVKLEPQSGRVLARIPAPGGGGASGMAWAEGSLWVAEYRQRKIYQVDPESGRVLRTIESNRYVTGVTWVDGQLWHGTWEDGASDLRQVDARTGEVLQSVEMPAGTGVSGLESDGAGCFFCGGGESGKLRTVRRPSAQSDDTVVTSG
ncbi:glutaminyl-peptide cyclotransferase [Achromobacter insolitus]|uniref:Glutamine cyclotransferase n=1 Tax=Achromobacter insolitus TaxID=217204 RepID=A0A6S7EWX5_9BURK|nr:glutaminyl-peptide cyclotransferase [Achromobacter insolitus]CAB3929902.1 hypothetical protein LMG6000_00955 [Achromobacter insolitus]CAB3934990.1 hypothetical protein LMG5997_01991 [Achromobacter insolitus]